MNDLVITDLVLMNLTRDNSLLLARNSKLKSDNAKLFEMVKDVYLLTSEPKVEELLIRSTTYLNEHVIYE